MSSFYGNMLKLSIFGQSHSRAVGMTLDGLPAGEKLDLDALSRFLSRRAPGRSSLATQRRETDEPEFVSGLVGDTLCGAPLTALIYNADQRSADYAGIECIPRPGHADYTAQIKYFGYQDKAGGGHFSGRLTAPLCVAGGICLQLLEKEGVHIFSRILSIGGIWDEGELKTPVSDKPFPTVSEQAGARMMSAVEAARVGGDSLGGRIEVKASGVPAGLGDPMFDGLENRIAQLMFAIPAVKGIEFGEGFALADLRGSESNDPYIIDNEGIRCETNRMGGILGGISNGMDIALKLAVKPTPSIAKEQTSVDMREKAPTRLSVHGRHNPCIVPRALPCAEAALAIALYDALLKRRSELYGA